MYLTEALLHIEKLYGVLEKKDSPMTSKDHPEEDASEILNENDHQKYQMLIGMLVWLCCLGRININLATSSLSCYIACPCIGHLKCVLCVFGYLEKYKN